MLERDLGIPMKKQINNAEHVVMDVEHAHLLMQVARKYATTESACNAILRGARESLHDRPGLPWPSCGHDGSAAVR